MERKYIQSFGAILLFTGVCKIISACGSARILLFEDPIFNLSFHNLLWLVGVIESIIALFCLFSNKTAIQAATVAWLSTTFVIYRLALLWVHYHRPCMCMGNLTDALHIPATAADNIMKIALAYLLFGSYTILCSHLWQLRKPHGTSDRIIPSNISKSRAEVL